MMMMVMMMMMMIMIMMIDDDDDNMGICVADNYYEESIAIWNGMTTTSAHYSFAFANSTDKIMDHSKHWDIGACAPYALCASIGEV